MDVHSFVHRIDAPDERLDIDTARAESTVYDSSSDSESPADESDVPASLLSVLTLEIPIGSQTAMELDMALAVVKWISLDPNSRISCSGDLPGWLPAALDPTINMEHVTVDDLETPILQRLCATTLSGGNPDANTGGICRQDGRTGTSYVMFSDDWAGNRRLTTQHLPLSIAVRSYCYTHCWCSGLPRPTTNLVPSKAIPNAFWNGDAEIQSDRIGLSVTSISNGASRTIHLIPNAWSQSTVYHRPSNCLVKQDGICIENPPVSVALNYPKTSTSTCGGQCHSMSECFGFSGSPCECRVDLSSIMAAGLDRAFGATICVARLASQIESTPKLGGRDDSPLHACVCNSTYVSFGCCGSENGIIWEPEEKRLGRLNVEV